MDLTEELVSGLVKAVKGTYKIQYHAGVRLSASACYSASIMQKYLHRRMQHVANHPARKKSWL